VTSSKFAYFLLGFILTLLYIFPFYWLIKVALTWPPGNLIGSAPSLGIENATIYNFVRVFAETNLVGAFLNSVLITVLSMAGYLLFNSFAAYALTLDFPGRKLVLYFLVAVLFVPVYVTIVPGFIIIRQLGLLNTHLGVALPLMTSVIGIFIFRNSFQAVPESVIESARLDGASELFIITGILWPSSKAAFVTNVILVFIQAWNNFVWPLVLITEESVYPLPLALSNFVSNYSGDPQLGYAFALLMVLPVVVSFLFLQRHFIRGVVRGAMKA
jgi:ABC-type glycerol-3-phosphate transport system permease component